MESLAHRVHAVEIMMLVGQPASSLAWLGLVKQLDAQGAQERRGIFGQDRRGQFQAYAPSP